MKDVYFLTTERTEEQVLDFSVNVNPLGIPASVKDHFSEITALPGTYPDPACGYLTDCLAEKYGIPGDCIRCGSGADDLLYRLIFAVRPQKAMIVEPTYEEYQRILDLVGCEVYHYSTRPEEQFQLGDGVCSSIPKDCDMVFLCNPNNPTGQAAGRTLLEKLIRACGEKQVLLVVDESFMEFMPEWEAYTCKALAAENDRVVVIDAFTKTFSLAGFRLGFCISGNRQLLSQMGAYGPDYSVSAPAQFAGICALKDASYFQETYRFLEQERTWLREELAGLPIQVYGGKGNFLLLRAHGRSLQKELLTMGIKTRDCSGFYGLSPEYCRIAIRPHEENVRLLQGIRELLEK